MIVEKALIHYLCHFLSKIICIFKGLNNNIMLTNIFFQNDKLLFVFWNNM